MLASSAMKPPRNDVPSVPDILAILPEAKPPQRSWPWKNSVSGLTWRPMTCCSPRPFGGRCPSASPCRWCRSAAFTSFMTLLVSVSALSADGLWNGNTSLTATTAGNAWIGMPSPKQLLSCLSNNSIGYIFSHPASALYPLAAFAMSFSPPQFFFISLLTFYLQTQFNKFQEVCKFKFCRFSQNRIYRFAFLSKL